MCVVNERILDRSRSRVLCVINKAALAALIKGSTSSELGTISVGVFWNFASRSPFRWWMECANAISKHAGEPSRLRNAHDEGACANYEGRVGAGSLLGRFLFVRNVAYGFGPAMN